MSRDELIAEISKLPVSAKFYIDTKLNSKRQEPMGLVMSVSGDGFTFVFRDYVMERKQETMVVNGVEYLTIR